MAATRALADTRERFPGLRDGWARLDGPAGTQMVDVAIDAMADFMRSGDNANHGRVEDAAVVGVAAGAHERGHRLDRRVHHLRAGRAVEPGPAAGEAREAVAVHRRPPAARTSSASCG